MLNLLTIIKNNRSTFYDFNTGALKPIRWRILVTLIISSFCVWFSSDQNDGFLNAVLTAQSILVGFSFSVLFFLLSNQDPPAPSNPSIEAALKRKKLAKLSRELFYNVSYFNLLAIICVLTSLLLLVPLPDPADLGRSLSASDTFSFVYSVASSAAACSLSTAIGNFIFFCFYFSLIESMYTFVRTGSRISYYFDEKFSDSEKTK